jgi:hypothetical protein
MSERRNTTGNREWPWERPHSHEEDVLDADLRIDRWTLDAIRGIGATLAEILATQRTISRHLAALRHGQETDMATLDDVQALVVQTGVDAQETADRVIAAIAAATGDAAATIADLQAQVADLIAGNAADITPEQLQSVADGLTAVDATIKGIAPAPVVEPPVV